MSREEFKRALGAVNTAAEDLAQVCFSEREGKLTVANFPTFELLGITYEFI